jgi:hypothetical protein
MSFKETTFNALSDGGIKIFKTNSRRIKNADSGAGFLIKSTFQPVLVGLAHDLKQNWVYMLMQLDEGYKASILKSCEKKAL